MHVYEDSNGPERRCSRATSGQSRVMAVLPALLHEMSFSAGVLIAGFPRGTDECY